MINIYSEKEIKFLRENYGKIYTKELPNLWEEVRILYIRKQKN